MMVQQRPVLFNQIYSLVTTQVNYLRPDLAPGPRVDESVLMQPLNKISTNRIISAENKEQRTDEQNALSVSKV